MEKRGISSYLSLLMVIGDTPYFEVVVYLFWFFSFGVSSCEFVDRFCYRNGATSGVDEWTTCCQAATPRRLKRLPPCTRVKFFSRLSPHSRTKRAPHEETPLEIRTNCSNRLAAAASPTYITRHVAIATSPIL